MVSEGKLLTLTGPVITTERPELKIDSTSRTSLLAAPGVDTIQKSFFAFESCLSQAMNIGKDDQQDNGEEQTTFGHMHITTPEGEDTGICLRGVHVANTNGTDTQFFSALCTDNEDLNHQENQFFKRFTNSTVDLVTYLVGPEAA